jgi:hypothetical protein
MGNLREEIAEKLNLWLNHGDPRRSARSEVNEIMGLIRSHGVKVRVCPECGEVYCARKTCTPCVDPNATDGSVPPCPTVPAILLPTGKPRD